MSKTGLVTGCAGFIGSYLCERLLSDGWKVIGIDNLSTGNMDNLSEVSKNKNFTFYQVDVSKPEQLEKLVFTDVDCVFHLAGKKMAFSLKFPREDLLTNVYGTLNMLMWASKNSAKKFIFSSSIAVYGNPEKFPSDENSPIVPTTPYGVSKFSCEEYCKLWHRQSGLPVIILRYASVYGPRQATNVGAVTVFIEKILKGETIVVYGDGSNTRPFTFVGDVVESNILAANSEDKNLLKECFNVASEKSVSINELISSISKKLKKQPKVVYEPERPGELKHMVPDVKKIKKMMNFESAFSVEDGISRTVEYYEKR